MTGFLSLFSSLPLPKLTQDENACQAEPKDRISECEDGGEKSEETSPNTLGKERYAIKKAIFDSA